MHFLIGWMTQKLKSTPDHRSLLTDFASPLFLQLAIIANSKQMSLQIWYVSLHRESSIIEALNNNTACAIDKDVYCLKDSTYAKVFAKAATHCYPFYYL